MLDKAKLGTRFTCFKCGTKFYDLNRPVPTCPECEADQTEAPGVDPRTKLSSRGGRRRSRIKPDELDEKIADLPDDDDDDDDDDDEALAALDDEDEDGPDDDDLD